MELKQTLRALMEAFGPSGYEQEVAALFRTRLEPLADEVTVDRMGNVIARFDGSEPDAPTVMAFAHLDQLGFIVRRIEPDGYIQLDRLGGIPEKVLPGLNLTIRTESGGKVPGVIGNKSHHAAGPEDKYKVDPVTSLFVDVGAASAAQVRALGIEIGCPATYTPHFQELAGEFVSGTALDNRGALAALLVAAETLHHITPKSTIYLVGTVWEEFNLRGAMLAARTVKPDVTISLDVVLAGDTRDLSARYEAVCGGGPAMVLYNFHGRGTLNGTIAHEGLRDLTAMTAAELHLPLQRFAGLGILTDSAYVQLEGMGTAAIDLGFPARYTHTPVEVAHLGDIRQLGELTAGLVCNIDRSFQLNRY